MTSKKLPELQAPKFDFKHLDLKKAFNMFIEILKLNKTEIKKVAGTGKIDTAALIFLLIGAFAGPIGYMVFGYKVFLATVRIGIGNLITQGVFTAIIVVAAMLLITLVATRLFKGKGNFLGIFRVLGLAYGLNVVMFFAALLPSIGGILSLLAGVWMIAVMYVAISEIFSLDATNTILTMLVSIIALMIVSAIFDSITGGYGGYQLQMLHFNAML
ncbi:hypothetical protein GF340_01515 [Candidatus Peregrinibacteria bacterium]|nr:hypothetical protein [Candidatus Peregrinibacteria bacterium]